MKDSILLSELQNYLAYGLKTVQIEAHGNIYYDGPLSTTLSIYNIDLLNANYGYFKPLVRPLSELMVEISEENSYNRYVIEKITNSCDSNCDAYDRWVESYIDNPGQGRLIQAPYEVIIELVKQHYDIHDWIGRGIALSLTDFEKEKAL